MVRSDIVHLSPDAVQRLNCNLVKAYEVNLVKECLQQRLGNLATDDSKRADLRDQ